MKIPITTSALTSKHLSRLAKDSKVKNWGWNVKKLRQLATILRGILSNFERVTKGNVKFKVFFTSESTSGEEILILNKEAQEIHVYLNHSPQEILDLVPLDLCQELGQIFFSLETTMKDSLVKSIAVILKEHALIEQGITLTLEFLKNERGIQLDEMAARGIFSKIFGENCRRLAREKLVFSLLRPHPVPRDPIETAIHTAIQQFRDNVSKILVNKSEENNEIQAWEYVAALATFSVIAKKIGCAKAEEDCYRALSGGSERELAVLEFIEIGLYRVPLFSKHPIAAEIQLQQAAEGFKIIYNILKSIFEHYYDTIEVG